MSGGYKPFMGNTFMGSRVFPSGASIDSLSTYQAMVYSNRVGMNIPASAPGVLTLRGSTGDIHTNWLDMHTNPHSRRRRARPTPTRCGF